MKQLIYVVFVKLLCLPSCKWVYVGRVLKNFCLAAVQDGFDIEAVFGAAVRDSGRWLKECNV